LFPQDVYLAHVLMEMKGNSFFIFCSTCNQTQRVTLMLRDLGIDAICLHGQMSQPKRLGALGKFIAKEVSVLVATDVASRGLDIPHVDVVVNFDISTHSKVSCFLFFQCPAFNNAGLQDYIHRVGRTARAGRSGVALTFVTQYDVELFQRIEELIGKKLEQYQCDEAQVRGLALGRVVWLHLQDSPQHMHR
jgi:ATP-dependent RNA helicase DDX47/RRP3